MTFRLLFKKVTDTLAFGVTSNLPPELVEPGITAFIRQGCRLQAPKKEQRKLRSFLKQQPVSNPAINRRGFSH